TFRKKRTVSSWLTKLLQGWNLDQSPAHVSNQLRCPCSILPPRRLRPCLTVLGHAGAGVVSLKSSTALRRLWIASKRLHARRRRPLSCSGRLRSRMPTSFVLTISAPYSNVL